MLDFLHQLMVSLLLVYQRVGRFAQGVASATRTACETAVRSMSFRYYLMRGPIGCVVLPIDGWPLGGRNPQTNYFSGQQRARLLLHARSSLTSEDEISQSTIARVRSVL